MKRHWTLLVIASVLVLVLGTIFTLTNAGAQSDGAERCPVDDILSLSHEEQEQCIQEAGGKQGFAATVEAIQLETAHAQPTHGVTTTPRPTRTATPVGYTPPYAGRIEPISNEGQDFRGTQSVWIVGAVQNTDGRHFPFYVFTNETRCGIGTIVEIEGFDAPFIDVPVNEHWDCPEDAGILTITDATDSMGSVSFENDQGETGTFDLGTEEWTREGQPWLPAGRPTPVPTPIPGIVPEGWEAVEPYQSDTKGLAPDPHWLKFTVNAWWLGATLDDDGSPRRIIIKSSSRTCGLGISYIKENGWPAGGEGHGFFCPEDINPIRIIGATGPTGVITATDGLSRTITFDLGTEKWTLEGEPWLPETTPTP